MTTRAEKADDLTGRLVSGRYRLDHLVAGGGMAQVWAGTDAVLNRRVAVKLLRRHLAEDERFVLRFRREAIAAARLNHTNIVAIYDTCSEPGLEAIVMELVPGQTLRARLDEGRVPVGEVLDIGAQVAGALSEAHAAGLVHRDIKPANVLLDATDGEGRCRVVVTDFGIAKAVAAEGDTTDLTRVGTVLGTAKYLAPEQVEGHAVDGRTDVYGLGVVLYEALTGTVPFLGESEVGTALARLHSDPRPLRQLRGDISPQVEHIVMRAIARRPEDRFASAADLRAALLSAGQGTPHSRSDIPEPAPVPTPTAEHESFVHSERSWLVPTAVVVTVAIMLALIGVLVGRNGSALFDRAFGGDSSSTSSTSSTTSTVVDTELPTAGVRTFDPAGGDGENDASVSNLIDGEPGSSWSTSKYNDAEPFPNYKPGVGVVLQLEAAGDVRQVRIQTPQTGWSGQVYVADSSATTLAGWGEPVGSFTADNTDLTVDLDGAEGGYVLLWITSTGGQSRVTIAEVELRG